MTGTTSFLVSFSAATLNPLNGGKIVYFPKLYDLSDWLWWSQCEVLNFLYSASEGFLFSVVSDHYD